jgi:hypothetical protein
MISVQELQAVIGGDAKTAQQAFSRYTIALAPCNNHGLLLVVRLSKKLMWTVTAMCRTRLYVIWIGRVILVIVPGLMDYHGYLNNNV